MKIAVPTRSGNVDDHFGHCEYFTVFTIENKAVAASERVDSPVGCGCKSNIAASLAEQGVSVMLAGNMGNGAVNKLAESRIQVIRGCSGDINEVVAKYLRGEVQDQLIACNHHDCANH